MEITTILSGLSNLVIIMIGFGLIAFGMCLGAVALWFLFYKSNNNRHDKDNYKGI
jgi:hypothetical protein